MAPQDPLKRRVRNLLNDDPEEWETLLQDGQHGNDVESRLRTSEQRQIASWMVLKMLAKQMEELAGVNGACAERGNDISNNKTSIIWLWRFVSAMIPAALLAAGWLYSINSRIPQQSPTQTTPHSSMTRPT